MKKAFPLLIVVALACGAAAVVLLLRAGNQNPTAAHTPTEESKASKDVQSGRTSVEIQNASGPTSNKQPVESKDSATPEQKEFAEKKDPRDPGENQPVPGNSNEQVRSVAEALKNNSHPERLTPFVEPKPFDPESYKKDAAKYCNVIEPGRCFQSATPAPGVPRLRLASPQLQNVKPGGSVILRAQTAPLGPVSFTSVDLGSFSNKLTAITVQSNEVGVAEVTFIASPGTTNTCRILAASPLASGQTQYFVNVTKE